MTRLFIRCFDFIFSLAGLAILLPFFLLIGILIVLDSRGGAFFFQKRVGLGGKDFVLWKFRTMRKGSEQKGQITVGVKDERVTGIGHFLRKHKIDELPQLVNVLFGRM